MPKKFSLLPIFDTLEYIKDQKCHVTTLPFAKKDFETARKFLLQYDQSVPTFEAYRREIDRLIQWAWNIQQKSIIKLNREEIETYIQFCIKPPKRWISLKREKRFIDKNGLRVPNPKWRPFVATISKADYKKGISPDKADYKLSPKAIREIFTILSSFYHYLLMEGLVKANPITLIRQKSNYIQKQQTRTIMRLSDTQWQYCLSAAKSMAEVNSELHERTLFIISAMYYMYLRISEFIATDRWIPQMKHFYQDSQGNWWFKTVGKGNKMRDIAVCQEMLQTLKRYREHLNLTPLPSPNEQAPLIPKTRGKGAMSNSRQIRRLVQMCFDNAISDLKKQKTKSARNEANSLEEATVHWLRHTGISDDINKRHRPIAHVRDDAGHSSSHITDRYNDVTMLERHRSAIKKSTKNDTKNEG